MSPRRLSRRRALGLGLGVGAVAMSVAVVRRRPPPPFGKGRPELTKALESVLSDPDATRRLGVAYLRTKPAEASIDVLLQRLPLTGRTADEVEAAAVADPADVLARVGTATIAEFVRDDTVVVDGWRLGRSEARLAGLYAALSA